MKRLRWLSAPEDVNLSAWDSFFRSLRTNLATSWNRSTSAYRTLMEVRQAFGLPFIVDKTTEADPPAGAWSTQFDQQMFNLQEMVKFSLAAIDDVLAGKRKLSWEDSMQDFGIERLAGDTVRVQLSPGNIPILINNATGQPVQATGPVAAGTVSLAPIAWVGIGAAAIAIVVGGYYALDSVCKTVESVAEQKTMQTLGEQQHKLVMSGKATPQEAAAMTQALLKGSAEFQASKAAARAAEPPSELGKTVRTVGFIALGVGVLYLAAQLIPAFTQRRGVAA